MKSELFMASHPDIGKKIFFENRMAEFQDFRTHNKSHEFVHYMLYKIDHKKFVNT